MFYFPSCPYCQKAIRLNEEIKAEHREYADIEIEMIDEKKHPEIADKFDYYYVPTYYVGGIKLHEGAADKQKIESVFGAALES